jgi:hypothetical protein
MNAGVGHHHGPRFDIHTMHLRGPERHMLAASIREPAADQTWFVRVLADATTADAVRDEVFAFALTFGADAAEPAPR